MRTSLAFTGLALALGLAACTGSGEGPLEPNRLRATGLDIAAGPKANERYPALLSYEANGDVRVIESCFSWSGEDDGFPWRPDGPYCVGPEAGGGPGSVVSALVTGYPGTYHLEGYVRYVGDGVPHNSNRVAAEITVLPRR